MSHLHMSPEIEDESPLPEEIFSVNDLNRLVKSILESNFQSVWVKGEISNLAKPRSGHIYFSLKDEHAQVRCAMFRAQQRGINFDLKEGVEVLLQGTVSLYPDRGDYQIIATKMHLWGEGQLQQAFEALKLKLQKLGWFDDLHKKAIPKFPSHIGIVTSPTGDALQDILRMLRQRFPVVQVTVYPTLVQGKTCAQSIAAALSQANKHKKADVIILARGGGSLEDLWGFNEEIVAKAVFESDIPIVTGIGHEMDVTIADFVADLRAPTPTGAAQFVTPDKEELLTTINDYSRQLLRCIHRKIDMAGMKLDHTERRLVHPKDKINQYLDKLDIKSKQLIQGILSNIQLLENTFVKLNLSLYHQNPGKTLKPLNAQVAYHKQRLNQAMQQLLIAKENKMKQSFEVLNSLSPLNTLKRGYSITTDEKDKPITSVKQIKPKQIIVSQFEDGKVRSEVIGEV